jgi:glucose/mannose-6-phosphate isomerase
LSDENANPAETLDRELVLKLDAKDMLGAIESMPEQLEAVYGGARTTLRQMFAEGAPRSWTASAPENLAICGMGGSAIGADLVLASTPELRVPAAVIRGYSLPQWAGTETLVVAVSHSGETEETLACAEMALARGCRLVCACSGGRLADLARDNHLPLVLVPAALQPRASLGYLSAPLLAVLEVTGLCSSRERDVAETVKMLREGTSAMGPDISGPPAASDPAASFPVSPSAHSLARLLHGRQLVVYGAGSTVSAAKRWKGQVNENAKAPAFWNELPELDHNELMGWTSLPGITEKTLAVFLNDGALDSRLLLRAELTGELLEERGVTVEHVWAHGDSGLARLFSLVQLGDYVSYYAALLYGADPTPVAAIQDFKTKLAARAGSLDL